MQSTTSWMYDGTLVYIGTWISTYVKFKIAYSMKRETIIKLIELNTISHLSKIFGDTNNRDLVYQLIHDDVIDRYFKYSSNMENKLNVIIEETIMEHIC